MTQSFNSDSETELIISKLIKYGFCKSKVIRMLLKKYYEKEILPFEAKINHKSVTQHKNGYAKHQFKKLNLTINILEKSLSENANQMPKI